MDDDYSNNDDGMQHEHNTAKESDDHDDDSSNDCFLFGINFGISRNSFCWRPFFKRTTYNENELLSASESSSSVPISHHHHQQHLLPAPTPSPRAVRLTKPLDHYHDDNISANVIQEVGKNYEGGVVVVASGSCGISTISNDVLIDNVLDYVHDRDDWNRFCVLNQDIYTKLSHVDDGISSNHATSSRSAAAAASVASSTPHSLSMNSNRRFTTAGSRIRTSNNFSHIPSCYKIPPWPIISSCGNNSNSNGRNDDGKINVNNNNNNASSSRKKSDTNNDNNTDNKREKKKYVISCIALNTPMNEDLLACGCDDGNILIYNVRNGKRTNIGVRKKNKNNDEEAEASATNITAATDIIPPHTGRIRYLEFSPTNSYMLVSSSQDGRIRIYNDLNKVLLLQHQNQQHRFKKSDFEHGVEGGDIGGRGRGRGDFDINDYCLLNSCLLGDDDVVASSTAAVAKKPLQVANAMTFTPNGQHLLVSTSKVITKTTPPFTRAIQSIISIWSISINSSSRPSSDSSSNNVGDSITTQCVYEWNVGYGRSNFAFMKCFDDNNGFGSNQQQQHLYVATSRITEDHVIHVWDISNVNNKIHNGNGHSPADALQQCDGNNKNRVLLDAEHDVARINSVADGYESDNGTSSSSSSSSSSSNSSSSGAIEESGIINSSIQSGSIFNNNHYAPTLISLDGGGLRESLALAWYKLPPDSEHVSIDGANNDNNSNDKYYLAVGCWYSTIKIWGLPSGKLIQIIGRSINNVRRRQNQRRKSTASATWCLEFITNNNNRNNNNKNGLSSPLRLIDGRGDGSIRIWNVVTGECLYYFRNAHRGGLINIIVPKQPQNSSTYISTGYNENTIQFHSI